MKFEANKYNKSSSCKTDMINSSHFFTLRTAQKITLSSLSNLSLDLCNFIDNNKMQSTTNHQTSLEHIPTNINISTNSLKLNFSNLLRKATPAIPPCLLKNMTKSSAPRVKIVLRINDETDKNNAKHNENNSIINSISSYFTVDNWKKQLFVHDPLSRKPDSQKAFTFDAIFGSDAYQAEVCSNAVCEILQSVMNGIDGCVLCYGQNKNEKYNTMIGHDSSIQKLGIIPLAIYWLFKLVDDIKDKNSTKLCVKISAIEINGKNESIKDLLSSYDSSSSNNNNTIINGNSSSSTSSNTTASCEVKALNVEQATHIIDYAINGINDDEFTHILFTIQLYQYNVGKDCVATSAKKSRLSLINIGALPKTKDILSQFNANNCTSTTYNGSNSLSFPHFVEVIISVLNGQKLLPYNKSKLTTLLKETMSSHQCKITILSHILSNNHHYNESMQIIQLTSKITRNCNNNNNKLKSKGTKLSSNSSEDNTNSEYNSDMYIISNRTNLNKSSSYQRNRHQYIISNNDVDYSSSSEQSCDTVIYIGPNGKRIPYNELTDNESPPSALSTNNRNSISKFCIKQHAAIPPPLSTAALTNNKQTKTTTSSSSLKKRFISKAQNPTNEIWIDGPKEFTKQNSFVNTIKPSQNENTEIWIDGPCVNDRGVSQQVTPSSVSLKLQFTDNSEIINSKLTVPTINPKYSTFNNEPLLEYFNSNFIHDSESEETDCETVIYNYKAMNNADIIKEVDEANIEENRHFNFSNATLQNSSVHLKLDENANIEIDSNNLTNNKNLTNKNEKEEIIDENSLSQKLVSSFFTSIKETIQQELKSNLEKCDSFESLECLDRALLKQLNKQGINTTCDNEFNSNLLDPNSRPISLLSVNSNEMSIKSDSEMSCLTTDTCRTALASENSSKTSSCLDLDSLNNVCIETTKQNEASEEDDKRASSSCENNNNNQSDDIEKALQNISQYNSRSPSVDFERVEASKQNANQEKEMPETKQQTHMSKSLSRNEVGRSESDHNINDSVATNKPNSYNYNTLPITRTINEFKSEMLTNEANADGEKEDDVAYKRKLEDLKTSYDQMIFKQSYREMESLHKTLESILVLNAALNQKTDVENVVNSDDHHGKHVLTNGFQSIMTEKEKDKRLSRILSPTRLPRNTNSNNSKLISPKIEQFDRNLELNLNKKDTATPYSIVYHQITEKQTVESSSSPATNHYSEPFDNINDSQSQNTGFMVVNNKRILDAYAGMNVNDINLQQKVKKQTLQGPKIKENLLVSLPSSPQHCYNNLKPLNTTSAIPYATSSCLNFVNSVSVPSTPQNQRKQYDSKKSSKNSTLNKENKQPQNRFINLMETINRKSTNKEKKSTSQEPIKQQKESILNRIFRSKSKDKDKVKKLNNTKQNDQSKLTNDIIKHKQTSQLSIPQTNNNIVFNSTQHIDYSSQTTSPSGTLNSNSHSSYQNSTLSKQSVKVFNKKNVSPYVSPTQLNSFVISNSQRSATLNRNSVSDNSSVLSCELTSSNTIEYGMHMGIVSTASTSSGGCASSSGYESMHRDSNDSDNNSTSSKTKSPNYKTKPDEINCKSPTRIMSPKVAKSQKFNMFNNNHGSLTSTSSILNQMQKRIENRKNELRKGHIKDLKQKQQYLMKELSLTKQRLMIDESQWSFDLHVQECMSSDDEGYIEALEKETQILEKRVIAAKSHIMMVTCFDINPI